MGFGTGLLSRRRGNLTDGATPRPPVVLVDRTPMTEHVAAFREGRMPRSATPGGAYQSLATVVTPVGTPEFRRDSGTGFPAARDPLGIVQFRAGSTTLTMRTLVSDARDLLISTIFERTAQRSSLGTILGGPLLVATNETDRLWIQGAVQERQFIHIGRTNYAQQILAESLNGLELDDLDADGFVAFSIRRGNSFHFILAGGSDYGTFFAVSWFLQQHARVRWFLPAIVVPSLGATLMGGSEKVDLFTVIPPAETFVTEAIQRIDEPDYRSRTFSTMVGLGLHSPEEIDAYRHWALCNRMRPSYERQLLFYSRPGAPLGERRETLGCADPIEGAKAGLLRSEERMPSGHNLPSFFSPWLPSMDQERSQTTPRVHSVRDMFPDPRIRRRRQYYALAGQYETCTRSRDADCNPSRVGCGCPVEQPWAGSTPGMLIAPRLASANQEWAAAGENLGDCARVVPNEANYEFKTIFSVDLNSGEEPGRHRYIPRTLTRSQFHPKPPSEGWNPCLYVSQPPYTPGNLQFRRTVAVDLAYQLLLSLLNVEAVGATEFCMSLSPGDGGLWCECQACRMSNALDSPVLPQPQERYDSFERTVMYKGHIIVPDYRVFTYGTADREHLRDAIRWQTEASRSAFPFTDDLDAAAIRGIIPDRSRANTHTPRLMQLLHEAASVLDERLRVFRAALYDSMASGASAVEERQRFSRLFQGTFLTFITYLDYSSAPLFKTDHMTAFYDLEFNFDTDPGTVEVDDAVLHRFLIPMVVSSRDSGEYASGEPPPSSAFECLARCPDQFCLQRWNMAAKFTGLYEYMQGSGFCVPRLYSRRLFNAIRLAYGTDGRPRTPRARVFTAETAPNLGLDGIKYYEVSQVLWDVNARLSEVRQEFCDVLFGDVANRMRNYFDLIEGIWTAGVKRRESPTQIGNFRGDGFMGTSPFKVCWMSGGLECGERRVTLAAGVDGSDDGSAT